MASSGPPGQSGWHRIISDLEATVVLVRTATNRASIAVRLNTLTQRAQAQFRDLNQQIFDIGSRLRHTRRDLEAAQASNNQLLARVTQLESAAPSSQTSTVARPGTSDSMQVSRDAHQDLQNLASDELSSEMLEQIWDLPRPFVQHHVLSRRASPAQLAQLGPENQRWVEIGCWMEVQLVQGVSQTKFRPAVNLRNTARPGSFPPRNIGVSPRLYHLALIGKGEGYQLRSTSEHGGFDVSHLCHNTACFNPDHLVIERREANIARGCCAGAYNYKLADGSMIETCPHWDVAPRVPCVLPVRALPVAGRVHFRWREDGSCVYQAPAS